jgi:leader peptidase (prepilin peptidase) / N-methyltransferase
MGPLSARQSSTVAAAVAALVGAAAGGATLADPYQIAASAFLACTMGAMAFEDVRSMRVPNAWNALAAIGGFVFVVIEAWRLELDLLSALGWAALSALICGGVFFLLRELFFRLRGVEGLGFGDVKLAATGGVWLGWEIFPVAVSVAALGALLWVAAAATLKRSWPRERKIPFAAFLAPAIWIAWVYSRVGQF